MALLKTRQCLSVSLASKNVVALLLQLQLDGLRKQARSHFIRVNSVVRREFVICGIW
jgi:hypothetical protein